MVCLSSFKKEKNTKMKKGLIFIIILQSIAMKSFSQVLLSDVDPKNDSLVFNYTNQYKSLLSVDSLFTIKTGNFYEVIYFNKSSCGHHQEKTLWYVRFNSDTLERIEYFDQAKITRTGDRTIISKFEKLLKQVENKFILQKNISGAKCVLDEIFISENQMIQSFAIGDGGFIYSGEEKISPVWLELINEIITVSFSVHEPKNSRKKMTNRRYLKSFKE